MKMNMNTQFKEVGEISFWRCYLQILNITVNTLSDSDIELLSHILAADPNKSHTNGNYRKAIRLKMKISNSRFTHIKDSLVNKGFLVGDPRDLVPHKRIRDLQDKVKSGFKKNGEFLIDLSFPIKIISNE